MKDGVYVSDVRYDDMSKRVAVICGNGVFRMDETVYEEDVRKHKDAVLDVVYQMGRSFRAYQNNLWG